MLLKQLKNGMAATDRRLIILKLISLLTIRLPCVLQPALQFCLKTTVFSRSRWDNVIYLNTFTRTVSPSLRVGYMVLPGRLKELFERRVGFYSCTVPAFEQYLLADLISSGDFERHINRVRRQKRREAGK